MYANIVGWNMHPKFQAPFRVLKKVAIIGEPIQGCRGMLLGVLGAFIAVERQLKSHVRSLATSGAHFGYVS